MSLQTGRAAIETYLNANWVSDVPMGADGHAFEVTETCIIPTISEGAVRQGSIGRVLNSVYQIGMVTFQIFVPGGAGSDEWRGLADTLLDLCHGVTLDATGTPISGATQSALVRFSPPELGDAAHPYIAANIDGIPFRQVNVIAPFVRYETR